MVVSKSTELRRLRPAEFYNFALILNPSENWKKLVSVVTEEAEGAPKFNGETITIIEQASLHERKPAAAIFLEEWATMGRKRPTLGVLLELLMKAELFRAADYLAQEILKIEAPARPSFGPAVPVDVEGALAALLGHQSLMTESGNANDPSEVTRTRSPMNLSRVDYPMHLLNTKTSEMENENCALAGENDVGVIEIRCREARSTQALDHIGAQRYATGSDGIDAVYGEPKARAFEDSALTRLHEERCDASEISDLIKFSEEHARSDLMKFSDASHDRKNLVDESLLPNFSILRADGLTGSHHGETRIDEEDEGNHPRDTRRTNTEAVFVREMSSQELPAILNDFRVSGRFHRELASSELPACINEIGAFHTSTVSSVSSSDNNSSGDCSSTSLLHESSESTAESSSNEHPVCEIREHRIQLPVPANVLDSQQLPVTVLEFQKR